MVSARCTAVALRPTIKPFFYARRYEEGTLLYCLCPDMHTGRFDQPLRRGLLQRSPRSKRLTRLRAPGAGCPSNTRPNRAVEPGVMSGRSLGRPAPLPATGTRSNRAGFFCCLVCPISKSTSKQNANGRSLKRQPQGKRTLCPRLLSWESENERGSAAPGGFLSHMYQNLRAFCFLLSIPRQLQVNSQGEKQ